MITIASLLDKKANKKTENIWNLLDHECELSDIKTVPYPHFSWLTAQSIPEEQVQEQFLSLTNSIPTFSVKTTGFGIFSGESPILYLPLVKSRKLAQFHEMIWERLFPFAVDANSYYSPENWVPHITVGYGDVTPQRLACAVQKLATIDLEMDIFVDNLSMLTKDGEEASIGFIHKLK